MASLQLQTNQLKSPSFSEVVGPSISPDISTEFLAAPDLLSQLTCSSIMQACRTYHVGIGNPIESDVFERAVEASYAPISANQFTLGTGNPDKFLKNLLASDAVERIANSPALTLAA